MNGAHIQHILNIHLGVSKNRGGPPQIIHLFIGFSINHDIFSIHFGVALFLGGNIHVVTPISWHLCYYPRFASFAFGMPGVSDGMVGWEGGRGMFGKPWDFLIGYITHRIHGTGIFPYSFNIQKSTIHVGKYTMASIL